MAVGLQLARDLAEYSECVHTFRLADVDEQFEMLREMGNVFVVPPFHLVAPDPAARNPSPGTLPSLPQHPLVPYPLPSSR